MILLNPGPVNLSERVRAALAGPDLCHREPEFGELQSEIRRNLLAVYDLDPEQWAALPLTGSGTAALEAMLGSLVPATGHLLVVTNGVYGERAAEIARRYRLPTKTLAHPWKAAVDLEALERDLDSAPTPTHVLVVHHETTTGRLNDLAAIGALCRARGVDLLVDAVSSFGAEALDFEAWGITASAGSANKCLHGAPGAAFVLTRRAALPPRRVAAASLYLDLGAYCRAQDAGDCLFTPAVPIFHALAEALREHAEDGGWRARRRRYGALAQQAAQGLAALGIEPLLPQAASSVVLRAYRLPARVSYATLHDGLKARGFVIYAGQAALAREIFRIATMGQIAAADIQALLAAIGELVTPASPQENTLHQHN